MSVISDAAITYEERASLNTARNLRRQAKLYRAVAHRASEQSLAEMFLATSRECEEQAARLEAKLILSRTIP